ncbi:MAG: XTP/dITP diphosphatase [Pirellulaceae bacterium]
MPPIVLASRNAKKAIEMAELLAPHSVKLVAATDFPEAPDVVESGETFAENAARKASQTALALSRWTLADDSGLMVDALDGAPGVYSARYAGPQADDDANKVRLLAELADVPDERRTARFVCHLAVADPAGEIRLSVEGACAGRILRQQRGGGGFGYDPLFLVPEYDRTFAELSLAVKSRLSHRARAFDRLITNLLRLLDAEASA